MGTRSGDTWLDAVPGRSSALVLDGPPGIGKTHALRDLLDRARNTGARILRAQPAQAEHRLVGSALIDLCEPVGDDEIVRLPGVQATALRTALLRIEPEAATTPHIIAFAFTSLLRLLSADQTLLVCIDDLQWLDAQTAEVLAFAARRLPERGVGILATLRTDPETPAPTVLAELAAALPLTRSTVAPLGAERLASLLRAELGRDLSARAMRAAVRGSGGNPLFALEIARVVGAGDGPGGLEDEPLPVPESLFELVGRHVTALPEPTRAALAAAAALRRPTLAQLHALGRADALDPAGRAGLITVRNREIVFNHPMYAAAAYHQLGPAARVELHAGLAAVADGDEERARHLAHGCVDADERVAAALDVARVRAVARGALDAALDAARLAVRTTPDGSPALVARRLELSTLLFRAGDGEAARREATAAVDEAAEPLTRARALYALARLVNDTADPFEAVPLYLQALELAGPDPLLAADIHTGLSICYSDDWHTGLEHARTACALIDAQPAPDPIRSAKALAAVAGTQFYAGGGLDDAACRRAIELQAGDLSLAVSDRAIAVLFYLQFWVDDFAGARETMDAAYQLSRDEGDEGSRGYVLATRARLEVRAGRWAEAERLIDECVALAEAVGNPQFIAMMNVERAWLAAYRGDLDTAVAAAEQDIERGIAVGNPLAEQRGRGLRGWCALAAGNYAAAAADLDRYIALFESNHAAEPALRQLAGDHIEALVGAGRLADAERALTALVGPATRLGRTATLAAAARAEALLRAELGDAGAAGAAAVRSLELYAALERPLERARTLLAKGQIHRRFKQRGLARPDLAAALGAFEELGAHGFAARTRLELARLGSRGPASGELSATERRIAEHAARGLRSAEIGRTLFLSTKTVSANLTRIYQKLGVRNRAELVARLSADGPDQPVGASNQASTVRVSDAPT